MSKFSQTPSDQEYTPSLSQETNKVLNVLCRDFATNMVDVATNESEYKEGCKLLLTNAENNYPERSDKYLSRVRNILIIGAGASKDANYNINTAFDVVNQIIKEENLTSEVETELRIIRDREKYRNRYHENESFEDYISALSEKIDDQTLRDKLRKHLGYRHNTSLFYEIVGHMFKHRLIDVIINFNFDEILDNIIEDEMGASEYYKILLNGHCPEEFSDLYILNKLSIPVYIKPHGTVSHAASLKFQYDHYSKSNKTIKLLIADLLVDRDNADSILPVNIISAGYSFNDSDLIEILSGAEKENENKLSYYVFDFKAKDDYLKDSRFFNEIANSVSEGYFNYIGTDQIGLGEMFEIIWDKTVKNFHPDFNRFYPKGIARHKLIATIFKSSEKNPLRFLVKTKDENYAANRKKFIHYLKTRILVEIAIVLAKSEGIIHYNQFKDGRVKKYITLYSELFKDEVIPNSLHNFIEKFEGVERYFGKMADT